MILQNLDKFHEIVIQVHDNPDADAVGSGYAMYRYFLDKNKDVRLIYGGKFDIVKSNMVMMVEELDIPIEHVTTLEKPELLLTVDCQYGEGNVQKFEAQNVAMIDHHNTGRESDDMAEIRSHLVSCATVCYAMLSKSGYDVNADVRVATALYYGLFMDSNQLAEIRHPYDRDMVDFFQYDRGLVNRLKYANLSRVDFETAGIAILRHNYIEKHRLAIIISRECDPNILGVIGDLALQVDSIDVCIVYCEVAGGYKISVRSCLLEVAANELAAYITEGIGNGGGHLDKAGGFISSYQFNEKYVNQSLESFLFQRMDYYFGGFEVIRYSDGRDKSLEYKVYQKRPYKCGYVKSADLFPDGTECRVRTLEGDVFITCSENIYIMVGIEGEVYPIKKDGFKERYDLCEEKYDKVFEYPPTIINKDDNSRVELTDYINSCMSRSGAKIYARPADKPTKVFSKWQYETYMRGNPGDMICYSYYDEEDVHVVKKELFNMLYEEEK